MRFVVLAALAASAASNIACAPPPSSTIDVGDGDVRAVVSLEPFAIAMGGRGAPPRLVLGADAAPPYGALSTAIDWYGEEPQILPGWDDYVEGVDRWRDLPRATVVEQSASAATFALDGDEARGTFTVVVDGARVRLQAWVEPKDDAEPFSKTSLAFRAADDERFFGLGERYASLQHRGLSLYSWTEEVGLGQGEDVPRGDENPFPNGPSMTGFPVPFLLSTAGWGMHVDTTRRIETHLGSELEDAWRLAVAHDEVALTVYVRDDPKDALDDYTDDTGKPPIPAPWVFGPRRRVSPGQSTGGVEEWRLLRQRDVPTTGVDDATHFLPHRSELGREEGLRAWTSTLHAEGFKVMAYMNPYVSMSEEGGAADFAYGVANDFFVKDGYGEIASTFFVSGTGQTLATIDLTNPAAVAWFQDLLRRALALGYDGWMHDFGEYVRREWRFFDGRRGEEMHNLYPVLSAKAAWDLLTVEKPDDFLFFVRSGWAGTQAVVPAVWGSDAEATFDETQGIPAQLRAGLSLGASGAPYWGSDVTGFKCLTDAPRDKEMYLRWAHLGAVSPIMMEQNACVALPSTAEKWTLWSDEETTRVYGDAARLHTRLQPYFLALAVEAHARGTPIMRIPFLERPRETALYDVEDAFFLGPSLYAAPVVRRGLVARDVVFPTGRWIDLDDHRVYAGGAKATVPAPLAKLPLFLAEGGIVPLLDASIDTLAPSASPDVVDVDDVADRLDVIVAPGAAGAEIVLRDGTRLRAAPTGDADTPLTTVDAAALPDCAECALRDAPGDVRRVRANTAAARSSRLVVDGVELIVEGATRDLRVRWELLLPDGA